MHNFKPTNTRIAEIEKEIIKRTAALNELELTPNELPKVLVQYAMRLCMLGAVPARKMLPEEMQQPFVNELEYTSKDVQRLLVKHLDLLLDNNQKLTGS